MKKVIMAAVAAAFVSGAAQAAIITNGGNPEYSLTEIQSKVDNGEWPRYPYVAGTGVTAHNTLFANTFENGRVLPQFHDVVALQRAIAESNVVLVADASEGLILPCPSVFVELGRQNGVSCYRFMEHYVTSTTDVDSDAFGEHARAQTEVIIKIVESLTAEQISQYEMLIAAGIARETALKIDIMNLESQIDDLNERLGDWATAVDAYNAGYLTGAASVDITSDNAAEFAKGFAAGVASVDITSDNEMIRQAAFEAGRTNGINSIEYTAIDGTVFRGQPAVDAKGSDEFNRGFNAGYAAVDITTDNAAVDSAAFSRGHQAGRDSVYTGVNGILAARNHNSIRSVSQLYTTLRNEYEAGRNAAYAEWSTAVTNATIGDITVERNVPEVGTGSPMYNPSYGTVVTAQTALAGINQDAIAMSLGQRAWVNVMIQLQDAINDAYHEGYQDGYNDGYTNGYTDGFNDGVGAVTR